MWRALPHYPTLLFLFLYTNKSVGQVGQFLFNELFSVSLFRARQHEHTSVDRRFGFLIGQCAPLASVTRAHFGQRR